MTKPTGSTSRWLGALALAGFLGSAARAEEGYSTTAGTRAAPPSNALEVTVGLGSAQGYGNKTPGGDLGVGTSLGIGWRIDRHWMIGAYGEGAVYGGTSSNNSLGAAAGVQANYHFDAAIQPWVGLGTGWRAYWLGQEGGRTVYQGLDLMRLQAGFDVPISRSFTLAPVLGATVSTFLSQKAPGASGFTDTGSKDLSVFVFAGALARFDFFGRRSSEVVLASK